MEETPRISTSVTLGWFYFVRHGGEVGGRKGGKERERGKERDEGMEMNLTFKILLQQQQQKTLNENGTLS